MMAISTSDPGKDAKRLRRKRRWGIVLGVLAVVVLLQSITITLPIEGRVLDETSSRPVSNAVIAALWQLEAWSLHQKLPGGTMRVDETLTDERGVFKFPVAVMVHPPLLPFSPLSRSDVAMPVLIVVADGYQPSSAHNDIHGIHGQKHAAGFMSLRTTSLQGAVLRLTPLPEAFVGKQRSEYQGNLGWASVAVETALASCAGRWYCKNHPLAEVRDTIERGGARARPVRRPTEEQR